MSGWRRRYGGSPLHFVAHACAIAVGAYALSQILDPRFSEPLNLAAWLLGGALLHDLVLLPMYTALDAAARMLLREHVNHVRFPAVIAAVLFLAYFPLITGHGRENYLRASGHEPPDYLARWLAITAALFLASALLYVARRRRSPARPPTAAP